MKIPNLKVNLLKLVEMVKTLLIFLVFTLLLVNAYFVNELMTRHRQATSTMEQRELLQEKRMEELENDLRRTMFEIMVQRNDTVSGKAKKIGLF